MSILDFPFTLAFYALAIGALVDILFLKGAVGVYLGSRYSFPAIVAWLRGKL